MLHCASCRGKEKIEQSFSQLLLMTDTWHLFERAIFQQRSCVLNEMGGGEEIFHMQKLVAEN